MIQRAVRPDSCIYIIENPERISGLSKEIATSQMNLKKKSQSDLQIELSIAGEEPEHLYCGNKVFR